MTRACTIAIALLWLASRAAADNKELRASVELFVNDVSCGDVIILLRDATPWVPIEALRNAGLRVEGRAGDGDAYVSLEASGIAYRFDEQELQLRLTALPDRFQRQVLPVRSGAPADLIRARNSSAFLNYAAFVDAGNGHHATTIATDAGISVRGALLRVGAGRDTTGRFFRSPTHVTVDDETHLVRWDIGDTAAPGGLSTPTRPILGVSVSREFGIDPYFVRYTPLTLNGTASTPSIAEVYINGQLVHRERLAPGSFTLTGLPATIGAGQAEVVLRDTFGREQHFASNFYEPAALLRPGLQQFNYSLGLQRAPTCLFCYTTPAATAIHRVGVTNTLTLGATVNATRREQSVEPELATKLPIGELTTRVATSRANKQFTTSTQTSWSYRGHGLSTAIAWRQTTTPNRNVAPSNDSAATPSPMNFAASSLATATALSSQAALAPLGELPIALGSGGTPLSPQFAASSLATATALASYAALTSPRRQLDAQVGWTLGRGISMSVAAMEGLDWNAQRVHRQTLSISAPASRRGGVLVTAGRARLGAAGGRGGYEFSIAWTMQVTTRETVTAVASRRSDGGHATQIAYQRALPIGSGIGGRLQVTPDASAQAQGIDGMLQIQGDRGRIEMRRDLFGSAGSSSSASAGSHPSYSVGASGALVMADGGHVLATRTVDDAFAVVKVGDVAGVRVLASNQVVGRTNRRGEAVVPNLVSYYGNRLSIVPEDVPITYAIAAQEYAIAPALRGGAFVRFDAVPIRPVTGHFVIATRLSIAPIAQIAPIVPAYGEARVDGSASGREMSPLGKRGEFFFERLDPGRHHARVLFDGVEYDCALTVPADRVGAGASDDVGRAIDLGEVVCLGPASQAARP